MSFKISNLNKVTPELVNRVRRALVRFLSGLLVFSSFLGPKLNVTNEDFGMWIGLAILTVSFGASLYGVEDDTKTKNDE